MKVGVVDMDVRVSSYLKNNWFGPQINAFGLFVP